MRRLVRRMTVSSFTATDGTLTLSEPQFLPGEGRFQFSWCTCRHIVRGRPNLSGDNLLQSEQMLSAAKAYLRQGSVIAFSIFALSGCVSAVSDDMRMTSAATPTVAETTDNAETASADAVDGYRDPMVSAAGGEQQAQDVAAEQQANPEEGQTDLAAAVMQPSSVNAGQTSIFSNTGAATGQTTNVQPVDDARANPTQASIYKGQPQDSSADQLPIEPLPGTDEESSALPDRVPLPKSGRTALVEEPSGNAAELALVEPQDDASVTPADSQPAESQPFAVETKQQVRKPTTLAALFSSKREASGTFNGERFAAKPKRQVINRDTVMEARRASLAVNMLPGVDTDPAIAANEEDHEGDEDENKFTEIASLAGLARLAPNGLLLQTERVKTGCFRPELVSVLKSVEKHYGKPVIVTSGLRKARNSRKRQSLHTRCEAADIQIAGVSKWELAEYLRTMPGRGGVGTYCHTESVHIDIGSERDWNWRCRRKKRK